MNIKKILSIATLILSSVLAYGQYVPTVFNSGNGGTTNISFIGSPPVGNTTGTTNAVTYTCNSTSDRLILIADAQGTQTLSLTDTGGQASSATIIVPNSSVGDTVEAWNMGCASGSNTITLHVSSSVESFFMMNEYSGIQSGGDGGAAATGGTTSCTATATAATAHDLSVGFVGVGTGVASTNTPSGYQWRQFGSPSGIPWLTGATFIEVVEDNLNASSGSVSFAPTFPSTSGSRCLVANVPGIVTASPNFYPRMIQANAACINASSITRAYNVNVTSGNLLTFAFKNENASTAPSSISDTLGTSYTLQVHQATGSSNGMWIYTGIAPSSGADTLTLSGTFSFVCVTIAEISGVTGTTTNTGGQTTSSGTMTWSQTVSNNNSIVLAAVGGFHSSDTCGISGIGYAFVSGANGADGMCMSMSRVLNSGTSTPIVTMSTTDSNVGASIVVK